MPVIITKGAATAQGFGFSGGKGLVISPNTSSQLLASNPSRGNTGSATVGVLSGYEAGVYFHFVGDGSTSGSSCCGNCGNSSSGEYAQFSYTFTGGETSVDILWNVNVGAGSRNTAHQLYINGGVNNGKYIQVGSMAPECGYGNNGPPVSRSGTYTLPVSIITFGVYSNTSGNWYNDDYYYGPCGYGYGSTINGYNGYGSYGGCGSGSTGAAFIQYRNNY